MAHGREPTAPKLQISFEHFLCNRPPPHTRLPTYRCVWARAAGVVAGGGRPAVARGGGRGGGAAGAAGVGGARRAAPHRLRLLPPGRARGGERRRLEHRPVPADGVRGRAVGARRVGQQGARALLAARARGLQAARRRAARQPAPHLRHGRRGGEPRPAVAAARAAAGAAARRGVRVRDGGAARGQAPVRVPRHARPLLLPPDGGGRGARRAQRRLRGRHARAPRRPALPARQPARQGRAHRGARAAGGRGAGDGGRGDVVLAHGVGDGGHAAPRGQRQPAQRREQDAPAHAALAHAHHHPARDRGRVLGAGRAARDPARRGGQVLGAAGAEPALRARGAGRAPARGGGVAAARLAQLHDAAPHRRRRALDRERRYQALPGVAARAEAGGAGGGARDGAAGRRGAGRARPAGAHGPQRGGAAAGRRAGHRPRPQRAHHTLRLHAGTPHRRRLHAGDRQHEVTATCPRTPVLALVTPFGGVMEEREIAVLELPNFTRINSCRRQVFVIM